MLLLLEFGASWEARNKEKEMPNDCAQNSAIQTVFKDFIFRTAESEDYLYATTHERKVSFILINHIFTPLYSGTCYNGHLEEVSIGLITLYPTFVLSLYIIFYFSQGTPPKTLLDLF